ncbi:MAG: hypothetical protein AB1634_17100 [Thermodesulfobacteriota bacterium]
MHRSLLGFIAVVSCLLAPAWAQAGVYFFAKVNGSPCFATTGWPSAHAETRQPGTLAELVQAAGPYDVILISGGTDGAVYGAAELGAGGLLVGDAQTGLVIRAAKAGDPENAGHAGPVVFDGVTLADSHTVRIQASCTLAGLEFRHSPPGWSPLRLQEDLAPGAAVRLDHCRFIDNRGGNVAGGTGGAITFANRHHVQLAIDGCVFAGNQARSRGGALGVRNADVVISGSLFASNSTEPGFQGSGGAIAVEAGNNRLVISGTRFLANQAGHSGGAIYSYGSDLTVEGSTFAGNIANAELKAPFSAGAAINFSAGSGTGFSRLAVARSSFTDNISRNTAEIGADGAAIYVSGRDEDEVGPVDWPVIATITDCAIRRNHAHQGAGLYVSRYASAVVEACVFDSNWTYFFGGASVRGGEPANSEGCTTVYRHCAFGGNRSGFDENGQPGVKAGGGGAIQVRRHPCVEILSCSFLGNQVGGGGTPRGSSIYITDGLGAFAGDRARSILARSVFAAGTGDARGAEIFAEEDGGWPAWMQVSENAFSAGSYTSIIADTGTLELPAKRLLSAALAHRLALERRLRQLGVPGP